MRVVTLPPLRVWLETGYDGGKFGAWLLDVPGAFGAAASRDLAVSQSSVAFGWFRDWLARHGESLEGSFGFAEVVEAVAATHVDGYERNATFGDDARPVGEQELAAAIRRLEYARADLDALRPRLDDIVTSTGERSAADVLRHLAGAEIWLGSRLDSTRRDDGPGWDGDGAEHLAGTHRWAVENLRWRLTASNSPRTDGQG